MRTGEYLKKTKQRLKEEKNSNLDKPLSPRGCLPGNILNIMKNRQERTPEICMKAYCIKRVKVSALRHCGASAADKTI